MAEVAESPKGYPAHYALPPPPAGSLSPVAMSALDEAGDTSQRPALRSVSKIPSRRVGIAILSIGAALGISFSLVQHTHHHRHVAAAAPAAVATIEPVAPTLAPEEAPAPAPVATIELDTASAPAVLVPPRTHPKLPKAIRAKALKVGIAVAPKPKDEPKPAPKVEPPAPKPAVAVVTKEAPKKPDAPAASAAKMDEAASLLKAAKGATENSL